YWIGGLQRPRRSGGAVAAAAAFRRWAPRVRVRPNRPNRHRRSVRTACRDRRLLTSPELHVFGLGCNDTTPVSTLSGHCLEKRLDRPDDGHAGCVGGRLG